MKNQASRTRPNASAPAPASQPANRTISITLSPALCDALEVFCKSGQATLAEVCEYWLFTSFHNPNCTDPDPPLNVPSSALISDGARRLAAVLTHPLKMPASATRTIGEHWSAAEPRRLSDMIPDREEMELAILQAEGLIELLAQRAGAALKENGGYVAGASENGIIEVASATCRRLHAAFYGRAA